MGTVLDARGVTKSFRSGLFHTVFHQALTEVSFSLANGEILAVLGPSGAGKTTLARAVLDQITLDRGCIFRFGREDMPREWTSWVGYEPEAFLISSPGTGGNLLRSAARRHGVRRELVEKRVEKILDSLGLVAYADIITLQYSRGIAARFGIALATVHHPRLVILDDPTSGLDLFGRCRLRKLLRDLRHDGVACLITSHELSDVESIADKILVLRAGAVTASGRPEELMPPEATFTVEVTRDPLLSPGWKFMRAGDQWYSTVDGRAQLDLLLHALRMRGIAPAAVSPVRCAVSSLLSQPA